jgi:hypothetical protein
MAAKKTAKKTTQKTANKAPRKATAKSAVKKSAAKKKAATNKPASEAPAEKKAAKPAAKSGFSSLAVNMGHVFALRPRVGTAFRQLDFHAARQRLEGESFKNAADAARAVVEKTAELSRGDANPLRNKHHKRF